MTLSVPYVSGTAIGWSMNRLDVNDVKNGQNTLAQQ